MVPATVILALYQKNEELVLSVVSAPDLAIVPEFCEPPWKDPLVIILGTLELAMPSTSRLPTGDGKPEKPIRKSSTKKSSEKLVAQKSMA